MENLTVKLIYNGIANSNVKDINLTITEAPLIPKLPGTIWKVGVSPWDRLHPECFGKSCHPGVELEILSVIAKLLNATMEFIFSEYPGCGWKDPTTGKWQGLFGLLETGEIDLIGNLCLVDKWRTREVFVRASSPVMRYRQSFLIKIPEPVYQFYLWAPFTDIVWCGLGMSIMLFFALHTILLHSLCDMKYKEAAKEACLETMQAATGMNVKNDRYPFVWFVWISYVGFFVVVYANFIKAALIKPMTVARPFENTLQLANKLKSGEFRYLDYHENIAYPKCYPDSLCQILIGAIAEHGYELKLIKENPAGTNILMNEILTKDNLVFVKGRYWVDTYVDSFPDRSQLWVMDDDQAAEQWSAYFLHKNFTLIDLFDKVLSLVGDYKVNLNSRYLGLSDMVFSKKYVKGSIPDETAVDFQTVLWPIYIYFFGLFLATIAFTVERYSIRRKKFMPGKKRLISYLNSNILNTLFPSNITSLHGLQCEKRNMSNVYLMEEYK